MGTGYPHGYRGHASQTPMIHLMGTDDIPPNLNLKVKITAQQNPERSYLISPYLECM